jgi:hypothetical protein
MAGQNLTTGQLGTRNLVAYMTEYSMPLQRWWMASWAPDLGPVGDPELVSDQQDGCEAGDQNLVKVEN